MPEYYAVYFIQKPFTADTEQIGCYYFNILHAVELCRSWKAAIVPPKMPLAPRDNVKVELNPADHWKHAILEYGSVDSREVLDYSKMATMSFDDFCTKSNRQVCMTNESIEIQGIQFNQDSNSKFLITELPSRWDTQGHDPQIFYNSLYSSLPLNHTLIDKNIPLWYSIRFKSPFLAVHWRRGDRGNRILGSIGHRLWISTEPDTVARHINNYLECNPEIEWVCVSTNSGSEFDKEVLQSLVKKELFYFEAPPNVKPLDIWKWDFLELLLCAATPNLMLSPGGLQHSSAFGRLMYAECLQKNPETALVKFMPLLDC
jgi:hypothetical protein